MPIAWVEENTKVFIGLFIKCAQRLKANHGYAGYACIISRIRDNKMNLQKLIFLENFGR